MIFEMQPRIHNDLIRLTPLQAEDFEALYAVACDPLIWEQHPNPERYQRAVFENYFRGAVESGSASCVFDQSSGELIGSSRYYDYDEAQRSICIGYTFIARSTWGRGYNGALKSLMLAYAFKHVERAFFHVGAANWRSRKAMQKLGAALVGEVSMSYYGEASKPNVIYEITKGNWTSRQ